MIRALCSAKWLFLARITESSKKRGKWARKLKKRSALPCDVSRGGGRCANPFSRLKSTLSILPTLPPMFVLGAFDDCYLMTLLTFVDAHEAYWIVSNVAIFIYKEYPLRFLCTRSIFLHMRPLIFGRKKPCFAVKNSLQAPFFDWEV